MAYEGQRDHMLVIAHSSLEGVDDFGDTMREMGVYVDPGDDYMSLKVANFFKPNAIALGCSVPPEMAVPVLIEAMQRWPNIRRVRLSSDQRSYQSDNVHYEVCLGLTIDAKDMPRFQEWTTEHIGLLREDMGLMQFHGLVRSLCQVDFGPTENVPFVGGPFDGQIFNLQRHPIAMPKKFPMAGHVYELHKTEQGHTYRYLGPANQ